MVTFLKVVNAIQVEPTFLVSDIHAKRQSAQMSEIKNVG